MMLSLQALTETFNLSVGTNEQFRKYVCVCASVCTSFSQLLDFSSGCQAR